MLIVKYYLDVIGHIIQKDTLKYHERSGRTTTLLQFVLEDLRLLSCLINFYLFAFS